MPHEPKYFSKKKKKTIIYLISGILIIAGIGTIAYFAWPKNKSVESKEQSNFKQEIQKLQSQLNSVKSKLNSLSSNDQKTYLKNKLTGVENSINNLANQNNSPQQSTIKNLEEQIRKIKEKIEGEDKPNRNDDPNKDPEPTNNKKEGKFIFYGDSKEKNEYVKFGRAGSNFLLFFISKNHPQIKKLADQGKLQEDKQFTIRYGKANETSEKGANYTFNENNQELEIIEVKNPNPQNNKGFNFVSTKINDNTYKYHITLNGGQIDFSDFIFQLKIKEKKLFKAFQGALKDANSKFPGYFWECPPTSEKTFDKPFEFVVIKSESLANMTQDYKPFKDYLADAFLAGEKYAISFPNRPSSGVSDAILIIPSNELEENKDYKNLSQFTKNAPEEQQQELWKKVAEKLSEELKKGDAPRWLSTHGSGVKYLHVRIDEKPKYYQFGEYKK